MKRIFAVSLCILLLLCAGCGASSGDTAPGASPASASFTDPDSSTKPHSALFESDSSQQPDSSGASAPTSDLSPGATVVGSHSCYNAPYCFRPTESGTYHFSSVTADDFQGKNAGYDADVITWNVYVLSQPLAEGATIDMLDALPAIQNLNSSVDIALKAGEYVYCVCSLNQDTASASPEYAGTLTITPLDSDFLPDASNNYQLSVTVNSESRCDLDGDGTEDTICYTVKPSANLNNYIGYDLQLVINGVEFFHPSEDNPATDFGIWVEGPNVEYYYIVDLDTSDPYLELVIAEWGVNDYLNSHYFRYEAGTLSYLGYAAGFPDQHTTVYNGDGTFVAMDRLDILQTWSGLRTFVLEDGRIVHKSGEFFQPELSAGWTVSLLQAITVYETPDLTAPTTVLQPSAALTFPSTDGEHWVQIRCADGSSGWAYFSDFSTLVSDGTDLIAYEIFGNLFLAG